MDPKLVERLSRQRPRAWAKTIVRYRAVDEYFAIPNAGRGEVRACASRLGVDERTFYRLIADRRQGPAGRGRPYSRQPVKKKRRASSHSSHPALEAIIAEAIRITPQPCRILDIYMKVIRLCTERGVAPPMPDMVRRRFREDNNNNNNTDGKFRSDLDRLILDTCRLDFSVEDGNGREAPAMIVALLHPSSQTVIAHEIFCGPPSAAEIGVVLNEAALEIGGRSITVSFALRDKVRALTSLLAPAGISVLPHSYHLSGAADITGPGEALLHVFGLRIGPIAIRSRGLRSTNSPAAGSLDVARAVCARLIESYRPS